MSTILNVLFFRVKTTSSIGDVFMGYHDDTCSAIVLHVWREARRNDRDTVMKQVHIITILITFHGYCSSQDDRHFYIR